MAKKPLGPIGRRWYTPEEFRSLAASGKTDSDAAVRTYLTCDAIEKAADDSRTAKFTISTDAVDRQRDVIAQDGWKIDNFIKNPVVLFSHDYSALPVGRALSVTTHQNKLVAEVQFVEADIYPFAETVYQMVKRGYLRAVSVGFAPITYAFNVERGGIDYAAQELLEFSIVPVPANAEALMAASADGIDLRPLKEWVMDVLKGGGAGMGLSKEVLSGIVETLEKAVPPVAKALPGCPKGEACPYTEGMDTCQAGEECPMKKAADTQSLASLFSELQALRLEVAGLKVTKVPSVDEQVLEILDELDVVYDLPEYETTVKADDTGVEETLMRQVFPEVIREGLRELVGAELNRRRGRLD